MIPIKIYDVVYNAKHINMSDKSFVYDTKNYSSNKINPIVYVNENGTIGFILTYPSQKIEMNGTKMRAFDAATLNYCESVGAISDLEG